MFIKKNIKEKTTYNKKINVNKEIKKKAGVVVICQPSHSITSFPLLFESQIADELIKIIKAIKNNTLNN